MKKQYKSLIINNHKITNKVILVNFFFLDFAPEIKKTNVQCGNI